MVELAKGIVMDAAEKVGGRIQRFSITTYSGFGCVFHATLKEWTAWTILVQKAGLEPNMYDPETGEILQPDFQMARESRLEPEYDYHIFVTVPQDWKPK